MYIVALIEKKGDKIMNSIQCEEIYRNLSKREAELKGELKEIRAFKKHIMKRWISIKSKEQDKIRMLKLELNSVYGEQHNTDSHA